MAIDKKENIYTPEKQEKDRVFVSDSYSSKQYLRQAKTFAVATLLKESKGVGIINQILLKTNSTAYSIQVIIDNETIWDNTYAFLLANTADIADVSAYAAGGFQYLSLQNLFFQKDFLIRVRPTTTIVWNVIIIRYNIRNEVVLKEY